MPTDLGDVLHYFMPEAGEPSGERSSMAGRSNSPQLHGLAPAALPLVGVPIGDRDVVRAAFTWNLAVEVARLGGKALLIAPSRDKGSPLWPDTGRGPLGTEVVLIDVGTLGELYRAAQDLAVSRAANAENGGIVFVRIPPVWLRRPAEAGNLLRWTLLFTTSAERDLLETYGIAKLLTGILPSVRVGITVHGAKRIDEAAAAFRRVDAVARKRLSRSLVSYGLLVDDLDVYRAIAAQRPIGLAHPQSPAALALRDVASLLFASARELAVV
jgi:hypothetical protein